MSRLAEVYRAAAAGEGDDHVERIPLSQLSVQERDEHAIATACRVNMPEKMRRETWGEMYDLSSERQREFGRREYYVSYMEGRVTGRVSPPARGKTFGPVTVGSKT